MANFLWVHKDASRQQEEDRLLQLRDRALNFMTEGILIIDRQGLVLYVNQGFAAATGYSTEEAVGQPWYFLLVRAPLHIFHFYFLVGQ